MDVDDHSGTCEWPPPLLTATALQTKRHHLIFIIIWLQLGIDQLVFDPDSWSAG